MFCWTPGLVVLLLDGINCESCKVMRLKRWLLLLAVLNSVMNPCIYSYKDEEMWATLKNLMRCIGNGTRRQRSTKANARPLSSAQDTGNSQPPSEETKTEDQGIIKTWRKGPPEEIVFWPAFGWTYLSRRFRLEMKEDLHTLSPLRRCRWTALELRRGWDGDEGLQCTNNNK